MLVFTARELDVLRLLAEGHPVRALSRRWCYVCAPSTPTCARSTPDLASLRAAQQHVALEHQLSASGEPRSGEE